MNAAAIGQDLINSHRRYEIHRSAHSPALTGGINRRLTHIPVGEKSREGVQYSLWHTRRARSVKQKRRVFHFSVGIYRVFERFGAEYLVNDAVVDNKRSFTIFADKAYTLIREADSHRHSRVTGKPDTAYRRHEFCRRFKTHRDKRVFFQSFGVHPRRCTAHKIPECSVIGFSRSAAIDKGCLAGKFFDRFTKQLHIIIHFGFLLPFP